MTNNTHQIQWHRIYLLLIILGLFIGTSTAVLCYDCNSKYDPRCGDPFDSYSLGQINCSKTEHLEHLRDVEPTLCRKITQKIFGKIHVIRGCGYLKDDRVNKECLKRSGTHEVQTLFCSCTSDFCNLATTTTGIVDKQQQLLFIGVSMVFLFIYQHQQQHHHQQ